MGFVPVDEQFRHPEHPDVFAAGVAIAIAPPDPTPVPAGVPKTGQMTETMAKVAAHNIAADLDGTHNDLLPLEDLGAVCVLDAGNNGVIFKAEHVLARNGDGRRQDPERAPDGGPAGALGQARLRAHLPYEPQARRARPLIFTPRHEGTHQWTQQSNISPKRASPTPSPQDSQ